MDDLRLIGDPHITRKFVMNVPLSRRGERENMLFSDFEQKMYEGEEKYVIMVGDLFERHICSIDDLYRTCDIVTAAARLQPKRVFVMMAGNHDRSAQKEDYGAFDVLKLFDGLYDNLFIVTEPTVIGDIGFFPWEWDRNALQQIEYMKGETFKTAIGHWDLVAYDDMHKDHFVPAAKLVAMGAKEIWSGHWHIAGEYVVDGITVQCTGSMQPMTHAEDPEGNMYVTLSMKEYEDIDKATLKHKYVRVVAPKGEDPEQLIDCLGFKIVTEVTNDTDEAMGEVKIEEFKMADVLRATLDRHQVPSDVKEFIKERINVND